jgi:hypothetical protein
MEWEDYDVNTTIFRVFSRHTWPEDPSPKQYIELPMTQNGKIKIQRLMMRPLKVELK